MKSLINKILGKPGEPVEEPVKIDKKYNSSADPYAVFRSDYHVRINNRRLEHLASLNLDLFGKSVLEVGAGVGDLTSFFLDRDCMVTSSDSRQEHLDIMHGRFPEIEVIELNLDTPSNILDGKKFDIIFCYGLLYHLKFPTEAIEYLSKHSDMILIESAVSFGHESAVNLKDEVQQIVSQSSSGVGCRPTRLWFMEELKKYYQYAYIPTTQPSHELYPLNWKEFDGPMLIEGKRFPRAVFIASNKQIKNEMLVDEVILEQGR